MARTEPGVTVIRACLIAAVLVAARAEAEERPQLVVFSLEPKGANALEAEAATAAVARGVRQLDVFQVVTTDDIRQLLAIERSRQLYGGEAGLTDLGGTLGARHAVVGTVSKLEEALQVEIRLLDTATSKVLNQKSLGPVREMARVAAELPALAQELLSPLLAEQQGLLLVRTNEEAVEVAVDDVLVASTPLKEPLKLARGSHRVQLRKDGFIAQSRTVRIEPESVKSEEFTMVPSPDYAEAWALRHGRIRRGAYLAGGIALAAVLGGVALDRLSTEPVYQEEFVPRQLWLKAQAGEIDQQKPAFASERASQVWDACSASPEDCQQQAREKGTQVLVQQIFTGGLVALGIGGVGFATYYYFQGEDPNRYARLVAQVAVAEGGPSVQLRLDW